MALPLPVLTFYRMPDASPAGTLISDILDAVFVSMSSATDYRGTALPAAHVWTVARYRPTIVTEAVGAEPPAGTPMTKTPKLLWAGRIANAGTMAAPDTSIASMIQAGLSKNSGAYVDWSAALPHTSGNWFGYWRAVPVAANVAASVVRVFISQETIFVQIVGPLSTNNQWSYLGAVVEPYDADTTLSGETDNRLYGMFTSGGNAAVSATWLSAQQVWGHDTGAGGVHGGVFTPGAGTLIPCGRRSIVASAPTANGLQTPSGVYVGDIMEIGRSTGSQNNNGNRLGTLRGMFCAAQVQSGRYLRNGATDLYHFVSTSTSSATDGMMLKAAA